MILVVGGTGTLGTRLVRLLVDQGQDVRVLTRDPARAADLPDTVQAMTGDLRDPAAIAAAVKDLLADPPVQARVREGALRFSWERNGAALATHLQGLTKCRSG